MRFLLYNIRYGTGTGLSFHLPFPFSGYLRPTGNNLESISTFIESLKPDIIGLVEVDNGSYRSGKNNQAEEIARQLKFAHVYESKYSRSSIAQYMPILKKQGNAFLTNLAIKDHGFHYFNQGIKRLVIELEFDDFVIFLVHLSIKYRHRQSQLLHLYKMFADVKKPMIVAGDFNAFWGDRELILFMAATGLINANQYGRPTYPSLAPKRQLDFILHSPSIKMTNFDILNVKFSDHMPLIFDFELQNDSVNILAG
ncbi:MAG: endonuclease/exonuclease/phosphatase family protein [Sedimentisphaerales bacterium]|nr:endonuclease/exonuclease/phosphatase family protein [Sedimentisphaerales bacterium]